MIEPIYYSTDFGFRIAARYGLRFYIESEYIITIRGEYGTETREPTGEELAMWYNIVSPTDRELISKAGISSELSVIYPSAEELFCALIDGPFVYFNKEDFDALNLLLGWFEPCSCCDISAARFQGHVGFFKLNTKDDGTAVYISYDIPRGFYLAVKEPIGDWPNRSIIEQDIDVLQLGAQLKMFHTDHTKLVPFKKTT